MSKILIFFDNIIKLVHYNFLVFFQSANNDISLYPTNRAVKIAAQFQYPKLRPNNSIGSG
jgi:hypothetical protein